MNAESSEGPRGSKEKTSELFPHLEVKPGSGFAGHTQPYVEIRDFHQGVGRIIKAAMLENRMDHPAYKLKKEAGAFLQGDQENWLLIEFWKPDPKDYMPFVEYLNGKIAELRNEEMLEK